MEPEILLAKIAPFLAATGMAPGTFGTKAVNDGSLVSDLEAGRECKPSTAKRIISYIDANWPNEQAQA